MDRVAEWATVHGVAKSQTRLKQFSTAHTKRTLKNSAIPSTRSSTIPKAEIECLLGSSTSSPKIQTPLKRAVDHWMAKNFMKCWVGRTY